MYLLHSNVYKLYAPYSIFMNDVVAGCPGNSKDVCGYGQDMTSGGLKGWKGLWLGKQVSIIEIAGEEIDTESLMLPSQTTQKDKSLFV